MQLSYTLWRYCIRVFWWIVILYSMFILACIYVFQFQNILTRFQNSTGLSSDTYVYIYTLLFLSLQIPVFVAHLCLAAPVCYVFICLAAPVFHVLLRPSTPVFHMLLRPSTPVFHVLLRPSIPVFHKCMPCFIGVLCIYFSRSLCLCLIRCSKILSCGFL